MKKKTVTAFVPSIPGWSPGQRVRIEAWEKYLRQADWQVEFHHFEDEALHDVLYTQNNTLKKITRMLRCYHQQLNNVLSKPLGDVVFVYKEAALIGPAWIEKIVARKKVPIIFDLDDPVFLSYKSPTSGWASLLKCSKKTHKIFALSSQIIAINNIIGDYAKNFNPNVTVIPNCVDVEKYKPRDANENVNPNQPRLIWIGSHSTMPNLLEISGPLKKIQSIYNCPLIVIGAGEIYIDGVEIDMRQWSAATEVTDLQQGDIGLVPLIYSDWNQWKFFFKTIQYMAIGIPVVAPRIGSNIEIIEDGVNGFLVDSEQEWFERLEVLIKNYDLRREMGFNARKTIEANFSAEIQMPRMVGVFEKAITKNI